MKTNPRPRGDARRTRRNGGQFGTGPQNHGIDTSTINVSPIKSQKVVAKKGRQQKQHGGVQKIRSPRSGKRQQPDHLKGDGRPAEVCDEDDVSTQANDVDSESDSDSESESDSDSDLGSESEEDSDEDSDEEYDDEETEDGDDTDDGRDDDSDVDVDGILSENDQSEYEYVYEDSSDDDESDYSGSCSVDSGLDSETISFIQENPQYFLPDDVSTIVGPTVIREDGETDTCNSSLYTLDQPSVLSNIYDARQPTDNSIDSSDTKHDTVASEDDIAALQRKKLWWQAARRKLIKREQLSVRSGECSVDSNSLLSDRVLREDFSVAGDTVSIHMEATVDGTIVPTVNSADTETTLNAGTVQSARRDCANGNQLENFDELYSTQGFEITLLDQPTQSAPSPPPSKMMRTLEKSRTNGSRSLSNGQSRDRKVKFKDASKKKSDASVPKTLPKPSAKKSHPTTSQPESRHDIDLEAKDRRESKCESRDDDSSIVLEDASKAVEGNRRSKGIGRRLMSMFKRKKGSKKSTKPQRRQPVETTDNAVTGEASCASSDTTKDAKLLLESFGENDSAADHGKSSLDVNRTSALFTDTEIGHKTLCRQRRQLKRLVAKIRAKQTIEKSIQFSSEEEKEAYMKKMGMGWSAEEEKKMLLAISRTARQRLESIEKMKQLEAEKRANKESAVVVMEDVASPTTCWQYALCHDVRENIACLESK